jgi:uncharacterized protein with HEPN domain
MRDDRLRLQDILDAVSNIERYTAAGRARFDGDELVATWVLHHLEIVGEACRSLSESFRQANPDPLWRDAIGFRNVLIHQYFGIDLDAVWNVVTDDLPALKALVQSTLAKL